MSEQSTPASTLQRLMPSKKTHSAQTANPSAEEHNNFVITKIAEGDLSLLLHGLLHELRNPLSSILTASSLLQDPTFDSTAVNEETAMLFGVIKKESLRLNHILTEFSNYIKLPLPDPHEFDLCTTVRSLTGELQRAGVLHARIAIEDLLPATSFARADPEQIRTALRHLFSNAADAMPEGGVLRLALREDERQVVLCLSDSGAGFSHQSKACAFQPFYSTKPYSIGLGMSAARAILEAASGCVWIEDASIEESGEASTPDLAERQLICVELPRAAEPSQHSS